MAAAIGNSLKRPNFVFESAGLEPRGIDRKTVQFLAEKGIDISQRKPKRLEQVPDLDAFHVVIGLAKDAQKSLPPPPRKTVYLDWTLENPSEMKGSDTEVRKAYERTYEEIRAHIRDLMEAIIGEDLE
jgi:protein-tyrosine-phosphatase